MNILLPVSSGASFDLALRLAIDTAKAHAGRVRVLSVVDAAEILLAVDDAPEGGRERIADPRRILADAGYPAWEEKVLPGPRAKTFLSFCDSVDADVVVLGGWGEHRWDDLLGLSVTGRLLEDGRRHLFLCM